MATPTQFLTVWRIFDKGDPPLNGLMQTGAKFSITLDDDGKYYFGAISKFNGYLKKTHQELGEYGSLSGDYHTGTPLVGGLAADFAGANWIAFTLNDMGDDTYLISVSRLRGEPSQAAQETSEDHGSDPADSTRPVSSEVADESTPSAANKGPLKTHGGAHGIEN